MDNVSVKLLLNAIWDVIDKHFKLIIFPFTEKSSPAVTNETIYSEVKLGTALGNNSAI